jgi:hypothetical protein
MASFLLVLPDCRDVGGDLAADLGVQLHVGYGKCCEIAEASSGQHVRQNEDERFLTDFIARDLAPRPFLQQTQFSRSRLLRHEHFQKPPRVDSRGTLDPFLRNRRY